MAAINSANRLGIPVSLVVSDLDQFKSINDTFGHASGDVVIAAFAAFLKSAIAEHQLAGRVGGEEFAVLLPGTNVVAARLFAEGARSAFSASPIKEGLPEARRVTASFEVAEYMSGESFADFFDRADKALYLAKQSGRDCVQDRASARHAKIGRRSGHGDQYLTLNRSRIVALQFYLWAVATGPVTRRNFVSSSGEK